MVLLDIQCDSQRLVLHLDGSQDRGDYGRGVSGLSVLVVLEVEQFGGDLETCGACVSFEVADTFEHVEVLLALRERGLHDSVVSTRAVVDR